MIINESFTIAAPLHQVAAFLLDPIEMGRCVPGVSGLQAMGDEVYKAALTIRLGPIQARFVGELELDSSEAPQRLRALVRGKDDATGSQVKVDFTALLAEVDEENTEVATTSDLTIRGKLGQFGPGVIASTARPSMARVLRKGVMAYLAGLGSALRGFLTRLFRRDPG